ncbi:hypothetical protein LTR95_010629 [Oleoguttula sp. CCFEE 5521]
MSVTLKIDSPGGHIFQLSVPLSSVAATDANTTYDQTHLQIAAFARRTVYGVCGDADIPVESTFTYPPERRLLESCVVERAEDHTTFAPGPDSLIVGLRALGARQLWRFIIRDFTPLRRVLNAYAGQRGKNLANMRLLWKGQVVGHEDTAKDLGICDGCELMVQYKGNMRFWDENDAKVKIETAEGDVPKAKLRKNYAVSAVDRVVARGRRCARKSWHRQRVGVKTEA